jgi:hypothetical protein
MCCDVDARALLYAHTQEPLMPMSAVLSGVFDPYMGPYIALEKKKLGEVRSNFKFNFNLKIEVQVQLHCQDAI